MPHSQPNPHRTILDEAKSRSRWSMFMGVLTAALGVVLIIHPFPTATATTLFLGWTLILVSATELVLTLASQTAGSFFLQLMAAVLYGLTGVVLVAYPFQGTESLTLFVGAMLAVRGVLALIAAYRVRPLDGWGWLLADAVVNVTAGLLILAKWPGSTSWAVGTLVGASVLVTGIARIAFAAKVRKGADNLRGMAEEVTRAPASR